MKHTDLEGTLQCDLFETEDGSIRMELNIQLHRSKRRPEFMCDCHSHNGFLTRLGYAALDKGEPLRYIDEEGSVSGLRRDEAHCG